MVMAGTERAPGPATDISLSARLQWLQQRREQLQEKLALKNSELKNLCIDEAELTGVLPPEIPLEPGESPPAFRKRVGTCLTYPQNLINRLKTNEAEESALELERQIQVGEAEKSLGILNDPGESKAVRRKHRSLYQQSQRRLRELDARLSFIRQAYGRMQRQSNPPAPESSSNPGVEVTQTQTNTKHRTKKPRPPLDALGYEAGAKTLSTRNIVQESGVSLSPSGLETHQNSIYRQNAWSPRTYRAAIIDDETTTLGTTTTDLRNFNHANIPITLDPTIDRARRRNTLKYSDNDLNDNHDVYILPDRYRPRTYSQGNNTPIVTTGQKYCQDTERTYRTIPNTYTEEERQIRYRAMQQKRHLESYNTRHNIPQEQHQTLHPKPPPHHNYQANYHPQQQQQQYHDNQTLQQPNYYQSDEFVNRPLNRYGNMPDDQRLVTRKNHNQSQQRGRQREVPLNRLSKTNLQDGVRTDGQLAPGYWIRENDEIVWCPDESSVTNERFGSLDRRKYAQTVSYNAPLQAKERGSQDDREQSRYVIQQHNANVSTAGNRDYILGLAGASKFPSTSAVTSHHQNYNSQVQSQQGTNQISSYERVSPPPPPRTLLRTQSLGSVETWQQQQQQQNIVVTPVISGQEIQHTTSRETNDCAGRRKEKEWYETSMDSGYSVPGTIPHPGYDFVPDPPHRDITRQIIGPPSPLRASARSLQMPGPPPPPPPPPSPPLPLSNSRDVLTNTVITGDHQRPQRHYGQSQNVLQRHPSSPKSLEIPAESKPNEQLRRNVDEAMKNGADRSPDLCTIVQAGKYQPYREVTKPFEMSDFYKYSTKYRKRTEAAASTMIIQQGNGDEDEIVRRRHDSTNLGTLRDDEGNHSMVNPVQRRIYEPVQRMTCQPYGNSGRRAATIDNDDEWRGTTNNRASAEDSTVV